MTGLDKASIPTAVTKGDPGVS